jgi:hypothetical protein
MAHDLIRSEIVKALDLIIKIFIEISNMFNYKNFHLLYHDEI